MRGAALVPLPVHERGVLPSNLHAVHADVLYARFRILGHNHRQRDERRRILRPAGEHRKVAEIDVVPFDHDLLARRLPTIAARRHFRQLGQLRQHLELGPQSLRHVRLDQRGNAVRMLSHILHAERHRHALPRAEDVDGDRQLADPAIVQDGFLEQQRLPAARHLHHAVGDFGDLQLYGERLLYPDKLPCAIEIVQKTAQILWYHER